MAISSHEYTMKKGYEKSPLHGKTVTWTKPSTLAEATAPGTDTNGKPYFPDEAAVVAAAVAQLNIKKGHAIKAALEPTGKPGEEGYEPGITTLDEATKIGRETVASTKTRTRGAGAVVKAAATKQAKVEEKVKANLTSYDKNKLAFLVEIEQITQAEMDAELARRATAKAAK